MPHHELHHNHRDVVRPVHRPSGVAWTALIMSFAALLLAFAAYDRAGANVDERIRAGFTEVREEADLSIARFQAASELGAIRARRETQENYPEFEADVERVRGNLRDAYARAKLEGSEEWRDLDENLNAILAGAREGGRNTLEVLAETIRDLREVTGT